MLSASQGKVGSGEKRKLGTTNKPLDRVSKENLTMSKNVSRESDPTVCSSLRAAGFIRNKWDGHRRFMIRTLNGEWQVYGWHIEHVAMCSTREDAEMVRDALEVLADATGIKEPTND